MIAVIVLIDQLVWRPAIAWSEKFKIEQVESAAQPHSPVLNLLRKSHVLARFRRRRCGAVWRAAAAARSPPRERG